MNDPFAADKVFSAEQAKLVDLQHRFNDADRRWHSCQAALTRKPPNPLDVAADKLLTGDDSVLDRRVVDHRLELAGIDHERQVLRRAIEMQRQVLERERFRVGREVCEALRPAHREIVQKLADALIALGRVAAEEIDFRNALDEKGVPFAGFLRPMPINRLGNPRDGNSMLARWLLEAVEFDLISSDAIPLEWRQWWFGPDRSEVIRSKVAPVPEDVGEREPGENVPLFGGIDSDDEWAAGPDI
jgi:hypothetical protein